MARPAQRAALPPRLRPGQMAGLLEFWLRCARGFWLSRYGFVLLGVRLAGAGERRGAARWVYRCGNRTAWRDALLSLRRARQAAAAEIDLVRWRPRARAACSVSRG